MKYYYYMVVIASICRDIIHYITEMFGADWEWRVHWMGGCNQCVMKYLICDTHVMLAFETLKNQPNVLCSTDQKNWSFCYSNSGSHCNNSWLDNMWLYGMQLEDMGHGPVGKLWQVLDSIDKMATVSVNTYLCSKTNCLVYWGNVY